MYYRDAEPVLKCGGGGGGGGGGQDSTGAIPRRQAGFYLVFFYYPLKSGAAMAPRRVPRSLYFCILRRDSELITSVHD
jgi:hypothetical protein